MIDSILDEIKSNGMYLCSGCRLMVKGKKMVKFYAFGLPFCICQHCAENAKENIEKALKERESE